MIKLLTDYPVAVNSPDHIFADEGGTSKDNSINPNFNQKLYRLRPGKLSVLDLGCAGGGFVKALLEDGHEAIGLEGSDYSKRHKRAEWPVIPDNLFTCDITKPFTLCDDLSWFFNFDFITMWEVLEHIRVDELPGLIENVIRHLKPEGFLIASISTKADRCYHQCLKPREWWLDLFGKYGLRHNEVIRKHFEPDWIRGPNPTPWAATAHDSFHVVLTMEG